MVGFRVQGLGLRDARIGKGGGEGAEETLLEAPHQHHLRFCVWGLWFRVSCLVVRNFGFDSGFRILGFGCWDSDFGIWDSDFGIRDSCFVSRVSGFEFWV